MNSPVFVIPYGLAGSNPDIDPAAFLVQLEVNDRISAPFARVKLVGDPDQGTLNVNLWAIDDSKLPATMTSLTTFSGGELKVGIFGDAGGIRTVVAVEAAGEIKSSLYGYDGASLQPVAVEGAGELKASILAPDSVTGDLVAPVVVGDALKVSATMAAPIGTGASTSGTAAASGIIKAANAASAQVVIQNTDAAENLYLSFTNPATTDDICLQPGMSQTFNIGVANAIYGLGSGAGCKYAIMELST